METAYSDAYPVWGAFCVKIMFVFILLETKSVLHPGKEEWIVITEVWLVTVMKVVSPEPGDCTGLGLSTWVVKSIATKNH